MVEHERLAVSEDIALSPVLAGFAKLRGLFVKLVGVRPTIRTATNAAPTDYVK